MALFIGLRAALLDPTKTSIKLSVKHFNPDYIRIVDEKTMQIIMDDGTAYRIDDESMQVFLSAVYGEHNIREDKMEG